MSRDACYGMDRRVAYRLEVETSGGTQVFDLLATNQPAAEHEAEYWMSTWPLRLERRKGRLFAGTASHLVKQFVEEASER